MEQEGKEGRQSRKLLFLIFPDISLFIPAALSYGKNHILLHAGKSKLRCLRFLFEKCDIAESELVMLLEPIKE